VGREEKDSYTPITDIRGMGSAIAIIKRDVREMKPEVKETVKTVVALSTQQKVANERIKALEATSQHLDRKTTKLSRPAPHDCFNANKISDLGEESKQHALGVAEARKDVVAAVTDIVELKQGQSKFVYWLMGAAVVVIGAIVGWYASYKVTTNEVRHLTQEQTKIRTKIEELQETTKNLPVKFNAVAKRMELAAEEIRVGEDSVQLDEIWCIMSQREKLRLMRRLPKTQIPSKRCR